MVGWFCVTLAVAFGSALVPVISIEVFVLGLMASEPQLGWLMIAAAVAIGQVAGKLLYYLAARESIRLPAFLHDRLYRERPVTPWRQRWQARTGWIRAEVHALRDRCHRHPRWMAGTYAVSAVIGLPPFMATTVLAGLADLPVATFIGAGLAGRFARYSVLAACPALFDAWLR